MKGLIYIIFLYNFFKKTLEKRKNAKMERQKKAYAEIEAIRLFQIKDDCINILNTSKNPDTFFQRYDSLIEVLERLTELEQYLDISNKLPSEILSHVNTNRMSIVEGLLYRYKADVFQKIDSLKTVKAKQNNAQKFYDTLSKYNDKMTKENITRYTNMYKGMLNQIEKECNT